MNTSQAASSERQHRSRIRQLLAIARDNPDTWACRIEYTDKDDKQTTRLISPIRMTKASGLQVTHVLALCLGREEPRSFVIKQIVSAELVPAKDVLMPEPIK